MNGAPLTRTPPRQSWGRGPSPQGWRRLQARRSTCLLLLAVQRRRVESLVLGALSSSPVHRALVLVLGTNIAVLLDCSKSSRQCSLPYLLLTIRPESGTRGMRGSKPAGFSGVGERAARSLDRVSRRRGPRRAAGASLEQRDLLDDVRRVREHSRGNDAGEVVGEVVRRVEAAVGGAVAPELPASGTAGKEAQAPGAAAAYAAKGLYKFTCLTGERHTARTCLRCVRRGFARRARAAHGGGRRAGGAAVARHGGAHAGGGAFVHRALFAAPAAGPRHLPRVRAPPHPPRAVYRRCREPSSSGACSAASSSEGRRRECLSTCRTPTSSSTRPARGAWPTARKRARTPRVP